MKKNAFYWLSLSATLLALVVIVLGAYVRLSDAGLGCPDWPGCYGHVTVPQSPEEIDAANAGYGRPVEQDKAWKEMVHRYFAGLLGLMILALGAMAWRQWRRDPAAPFKLPLFLVALVIFQALLGMWTVTLLLKPLVVTLHLLGGLATFALLLVLTLRAGRHFQQVPGQRPALRRFGLLALLVIVLQIWLGGWTSSNYAALACPDFPTCQTEWLPDMDFAAGFTLWHGLGIDYEGGILDNPARVAIHFTHRLGALLSFLVVGTLAVYLLLAQRNPALRMLGGLSGLLLCLQVGLGVSTVVFGLPLLLAVAHNAGAALLLGSLVMLNFALQRHRG